MLIGNALAALSGVDSSKNSGNIAATIPIPLYYDAITIDYIAPIVTFIHLNYS